MKLSEVITNLDNTIKGKEELLLKIDRGVMNSLVKINIDELKRIREDLLKVKKATNSS